MSENDTELTSVVGGSGFTPERVAIYARVSTEEQQISRQLQDCKQHIQDNGYVPKEVAEFSDDAISGSTDSREDYLRLQEEIAAGEWDLVVVQEISRLSRTGSESILRFIEECLEHETAVELVQSPLSFYPGESELDKALKRVVTALLAELAKVEREQTIERIYSGIAAAQERGAWTGTPPRGFIQEEGEPLRLDIQEYLNVRRAVERVVIDGESKRSVANRAGIPRSTLQRYCNEEKYRDLYLHQEAYHPLLQESLDESVGAALSPSSEIV